MPPEESGSLGSRHVRLFALDRRQCVVFCHDASRYCLFSDGLRKPLFAEPGDPGARASIPDFWAVVVFAWRVDTLAFMCYQRGLDHD